MKISLTKGLDKEQVQELKSSKIGGSFYIEVVCQRLRDKIELARKEALSKEAYESPSWAYKQADFNGYERALMDAISLIEDKE